jgi:hypothetical protein
MAYLCTMKNKKSKLTKTQYLAKKYAKEIRRRLKNRRIKVSAKQIVSL